MSRIPTQYLPDSAGLSPTVAPIDTYFQAASKNVAGVPTGPNAARQIAEALGKADAATQQFYFMPQHQQMIQQQEVNAQVLKDRHENFQQFSAAVRNGYIDQGDNPWLQVFTKQLYAKDAINDLTIRSAEFSDRQDILSGEYGEAGSAEGAISMAFANAQQEVLEKHGLQGDPYAARIFNEMSEPVRARAVNQFAQGLRRHNIEKAVGALEKDILNSLDNSFEGFSTADTESKGRMLEQFAAATKSLAEEGNLLTNSQVNSVIGRAVLTQVDTLAKEDSRTALNMLDLLDDLETSPGSKLRDTAAFRGEVERIRERIEYEQSKDDDKADRKKARDRRDANDDFELELNRFLIGLGGVDDDTLGDPAVQEQVALMEQEYAERGVSSPRDRILESLQKRINQDVSLDFSEIRSEFEQVEKDLSLNRIDPKAALQWIDDNSEAIPTTIQDSLRSKALAKAAGVRVLDPAFRDKTNAALQGSNSKIIDMFGVESIDLDRPGKVATPRTFALYSELASLVTDDLMALQNSEAFQTFSGSDITKAVQETIDRRYKEVVAEDKQAVQSSASVSVLNRSNHRAAEHVSRRIQLEAAVASLPAGSPERQTAEGLLKEARLVESDTIKGIVQNVKDAVEFQQGFIPVSTVDRGPQVRSVHDRPESPIKDLQALYLAPSPLDSVPTRSLPNLQGNAAVPWETIGQVLDTGSANSGQKNSNVSDGRQKLIDKKDLRFISQYGGTTGRESVRSLYLKYRTGGAGGVKDDLRSFSPKEVLYFKNEGDYDRQYLEYLALRREGKTTNTNNLFLKFEEDFNLDLSLGSADEAALTAAVGKLLGEAEIIEE